MTSQATPVEDTKQPPPTAAVRYGFLGWVGQFRHDPALKIKYTDSVVVKTERGMEIGVPVSTCSESCPKFVRPEQTESYIRRSGDDYLQRGAGEIARVATPEDLAEQRRIDSQIKEKLAFCSQAAVQANLKMRMVACEHLLGGERIIFYFTAEGRIDFRQLVRELAREYHTRIEMRQIGARDEARIVADLEICGRECCCRNFLKVLRPVNMKMAKMQKATLDPTKVSGRCGRLRCCLRYEQETYEELDAKLPEIGLRVRVEQGIGVIRDRQVITQLVVLDMGEGRRVAVPVDEIQQVLTGSAGEEVRPRRRPREESDDTGAAPAPRRSRSDNGGGRDDGRGVSRAEPQKPGGEDNASDAPAGEDVQNSSETAASPQQRERRGRRGGRRGRGGRDGRRSRDRQGGGEAKGEGRSGEGGGSGSASRGDAAGDGSAAARDSAADGRAGANSAQDTGKQDDGASEGQPRRPGRRRRRRRKPRSE